LEQLGADVMAMPTIQIVDPPAFDELDAAIERLSEGDYAWVLFASVNAVERFFVRLQRSYDSRVLARTKIAAVGPATEACLRRFGIKPDLVPAEFTVKAAVDALGTSAAGKILLPRPEGAPLDVVESLRRRGWEVDNVVTYQTLRIRPDIKRLAGAIDAVAFMSPSSVEGFSDVTGSAELPGGYRVVCIGPSTENAARELGLRVDAVADPHTTQGVVEALVTTLAPAQRGTMDA
jgi:uroporphyrinogen-III synthase